MAQISTGSNTAGKANVDSGYNLNVTLPTTDSQTGKARIVSENDPGTLTGSALLRSPETTGDWRLRTGRDTTLFVDHFNATAQNTNVWAYAFGTLTAAMPGAGTVNFSAVQGTLSSHGAFMRTFQTFPLQSAATLAVEFMASMSNVPLIANEVWLMGMGVPIAATGRPTDGVWFKLTSAGLVGVLTYNNTEVETGVIYAFNSLTVDTVYKFTLVIGERRVEYWLNDVLLTTQDVSTGNGTIFIGGSLPVFMHKYNTGAVSNTNTMRVSRVSVSLMDLDTMRPAPHLAAAAGQHSGIGQNGQTMGSTSGGFNNSALATTAAGSNTGALVAGLGGLAVMTAQATNAGAAGDMIVTSYQNPAATINIQGRNLYITGVAISCMNTGAAVATTPTSLIWGLAWGHTSVSLATTETASFATATTHSPRRIPLGCMTVPVGAAIGATYDRDVVRQFVTPIVVRPGEFIATTVRFRIGTATASQELTALVMFEGYWE